jgi:hypothetical protein
MKLQRTLTPIARAYHFVCIHSGGILGKNWCLKEVQSDSFQQLHMQLDQLRQLINLSNW